MYSSMENFGPVVGVRSSKEGKRLSEEKIQRRHHVPVLKSECLQYLCGDNPSIDDCGGVFLDCTLWCWRSFKVGFR